MTALGPVDRTTKPCRGPVSVGCLNPAKHAINLLLASPRTHAGLVVWEINIMVLVLHTTEYMEEESTLGSWLFAIQLCVQNSDHLCDRSASRWDALPASLDHLPQAVREFRVVRTEWPTAVQHRVDPRDPTLFKERSSPGENLRKGTTPLSSWLAVETLEC